MSFLRTPRTESWEPTCEVAGWASQQRAWESPAQRQGRGRGAGGTAGGRRAPPPSMLARGREAFSPESPSSWCFQTAWPSPADDPQTALEQPLNPEMCPYKPLQTVAHFLSLCFGFGVLEITHQIRNFSPLKAVWGPRHGALVSPRDGVHCGQASSEHLPTGPGSRQAPLGCHLPP